METIWIIGAGKFGLRALKGLSNSRRDRHFLLVDPVKEHLMEAKTWKPDCIISNTDGVDFLNQHLNGGSESLPDWVVPALPIHLAAQWCFVRSFESPSVLSMSRPVLSRIDLPSEIDGLLPNPMRGANGDVYVSNADFMCPSNCSEPDDFCTVTKKPRKKDMYKRLETLKFRNFQPLVIQSHQLGPGIGGYRPAQLFELLDRVRKVNGPMLLCTACRCHGVITGATAV